MSSQKQTIEDILDEDECSPKQNQSTLLLNTSRNKGISSDHIQVEAASKTQKQLFLRSLIKEIVLKGRAKTLSHQIGKIDENICLYSKPKTNTFNSVSVKRVPPSNNCHLAQGTNKFHQTIRALNNHTNTLFPQNQYNRKGLKSETKIIRTDFYSKRVTLSGLTNYKFTSVNAERSLSSNKINYEQKLKKDRKQAKQVRDCQYNRYKKILLKQSKRRYKDEYHKSNKIFQNLDIGIDSYLQKIGQDDPRQKVIYGEKIEHLSFIKQFMKEENNNYSDGKNIIDSINNKKTNTKTVKRYKTQCNQDIVFESRKTPKLNKGIKVRYFTFLE